MSHDHIRNLKEYYNHMALFQQLCHLLSAAFLICLLTQHELGVDGLFIKEK